MSHTPQLVRDDGVDATLRALGDWRRRVVLATVAQRRCVAVEDLVTRIAASDPETGDSAASRTDITVILHHHHLPELADAGLITYDTADRTVELVPDAFDDELRPVIDHLDELSTRD